MKRFTQRCRCTLCCHFQRVRRREERQQVQGRRPTRRLNENCSRLLNRRGGVPPFLSLLEPSSPRFCLALAGDAVSPVKRVWRHDAVVVTASTPACQTGHEKAGAGIQGRTWFSSVATPCAPARVATFAGGGGGGGGGVGCSGCGGKLFAACIGRSIWLRRHSDHASHSVSLLQPLVS